MQNSKIEWTDHTFNPWWGCQRVSPGCEHCYAETLAHRYNFKVWGPAKTTGRREMSANYWKQPIKWNKEAGKEGVRRRVFCASMADVFEDHPAVEWPRTNLWGLIETTPNLDWLLLTKRPENIISMIPPAWQKRGPRNVWYGTSAEDQKRLDERLPHLLAVPAQVRFLSCEPLLGPINLGLFRLGTGGYGTTAPLWCGLQWVIVGGESGPGARLMHPDWARSLRDQCQATGSEGTRFFFKQWGEYAPFFGRPSEWPERIPRFTFDDGQDMMRLGKHNAGRTLDGRTWDQFPP
jgi:protein gp37